MIKAAVAIILIVLSVPQSEWKLKKDKDGIVVHIRKVENSTFEEFKAETTIENTTLTAVLDVIFDIPGYVNLFPDCMNPKILKQDGKYNCIHYIQTKGPFTVKDRDSVVEMKTEISEDLKHAKVLMNHIPGYYPENKKMVRIQKGTGFWELEEISGQKVKVVYQFHSEPGGEIPAWLANWFMDTFPYQCLVNLKNLLK